MVLQGDEFHRCQETLHMVPTVRGSQGKSGKIQTVRGSQGIQKYHGAKVNKDAEKKQNCCKHTAYSSSKIFLLALLADYLYFYFFICSAALVSSVIASD